VIENMGRQSTAVFLQAFSPPGPERVYRDPTDVRGRAEFEVIRDPASAKVTPEQSSKVVVAAAADAKAVPLPRGMGSAKISSSEPRPDHVAGAQLELVDGAELQSKGDARATEVLYFVSGAGSLKVAGETLPLAAQSMVYLPHGTPYAIKVAALGKNRQDRGAVSSRRSGKVACPAVGTKIGFKQPNRKQTMNFELSQEQKILQKTVRDFCAREIIPGPRLERSRSNFPHEIIAPLAGLGVLGIQIPNATAAPAWACST
jgi:mannose-6-phosphate isomerase-like protein (cupin superfamily)